MVLFNYDAQPWLVLADRRSCARGMDICKLLGYAERTLEPDIDPHPQTLEVLSRRPVRASVVWA